MNNCCCLWPQWCFLVLHCPDEGQWGFLCLGLTLFRIRDCTPDYPNVLPKSNFTLRAEHWYASTYMTGAPCLCPSVANQPYVLGGKRSRLQTPPIVKATQNTSVRKLTLPSTAATSDLPSPPARPSPQIFLPGNHTKKGHLLSPASAPKVLMKRLDIVCTRQ